MIKNTLITFFIIFSLVANSFAQTNEIPQTSLVLKSDKQDESFVIQHKDIEITIGTLKISAPFLYQGELTPKQGYIVSIRDTVRLKDIVEGCQSSCDILIETITRSCNQKLSECQLNCDERVNLITKENEDLRQDIKDLTSDVKKQKNLKLIWSIISGFAGAGLGILVYQISN